MTYPSASCGHQLGVGQCRANGIRGIKTLQNPLQHLYRKLRNGLQLFDRRMRYSSHHLLIPSSCSRLAMEGGNPLSSDSAERRRLQNRAAQRKFRRKSYSLLLLIVLTLVFQKNEVWSELRKKPKPTRHLQVAPPHFYHRLQLITHLFRGRG
jgi:hypothetical protein